MKAINGTAVSATTSTGGGTGVVVTTTGQSIGINATTSDDLATTLQLNATAAAFAINSQTGINRFGGTVKADGGATLKNGKTASSVVMLATPQRVLSNLTLAATTYTYVAIEGSFTTNGQTVAIPSNAVAVIGQFITVPNGSSVANSYLAAFAANDSYTGTPGTTVAGISGPSGAFQYSGATLPLGTIPSGANSGKQGIKIYGSASVQVFFDVYGYITV